MTDSTIEKEIQAETAAFLAVVAKLDSEAAVIERVPLYRRPVVWVVVAAVVCMVLGLLIGHHFGAAR